MKISKVDRLIFVIIFLGLVSIILENVRVQSPVVTTASHILDIIISFLFISIYSVDLIRARNKLEFIKRNIFETVFILAFLGILAYAKLHYFFITPYTGHNISTKIVMAISLFNVFKVLMHIKRLNAYFRNFTTHPAQTIMLSFIFVILVGTVLLMMPFSTMDQTREGFINSLFTATSATCVTGLIVVDTATRFSVFGKSIIMLLMQTGGLGIMILASFTMFFIRKKVSLQERLTMSYILDESDTRNLARGVRNILLFTFLFELAGAMLLFTVFRTAVGGPAKAVFFSVFHSVSAFCNAGFALFSDSLEQFRSSVIVNTVIAGLIIAGGISFVVLSNSWGHLRSKFRRRFFRKGLHIEKLTLNTSVVLIATVILVVSGTLLIYKFEHRPNLLPLDLKTQYLEVFFQSVTLRTAGFNTMDISSLHTATYALMILFMFIGGASGSTAGGIKVNTLGAIWAHIRSVFSRREDVTLLNYSISKELINQAFLVVFLSLCVVFTGTFFLALTEDKRFVRLIFEAVSAFGTVGLSTGITPELTGMGKIIIVCLMVIGRIGPLTVITALARKRKYYDIKYPAGKINIG